MRVPRSLCMPRGPVAVGRPPSVPLVALSLALLLASACGDRDGDNRQPSQAHLSALVATGAVGMNLRFQCSALDAETALPGYAFDWGDGAPPTGTIATAVAADEPVEVEHAFAQAGTYRVRCRAVDGEGQAGPWSNPAEVHVRALQSGPVLTVALIGEGSVRSVPDGITCGTACEAGFAEDTWVRLEATPAVGWRLSAWEGDCAGTGTQAQVLLRGDARCVARFAPRPTRFMLKVEVVGEGDVSSTPAAMECPGSTCEVRFADGDQVTLRATPRPGWRFSGWGGDCSGTEREVRLDHLRDQRCGAFFIPDLSLTVDWWRTGASGPQGLAWSPDGALLAVGEARDGVLRVWDGQTADVKHQRERIAVKHLSVAWGGPGGLVAVGLSDGTVVVLDPATWDTVATLGGHTSRDVSAVAWSADGGRLASADWDGGIRLWDTATWSLVGQRTTKVGVDRMAWSPDGRRLGVENSRPPTTVEIHDLDSDRMEALEGRGFAWSPGGDRFAVGGDGEVRIFAPGEATPRAILTEPRAQVVALDWSRDGRWLAVSDWGKSLLVLEADTGALVAEVPGALPPTGYNDLRFHPTGPRFAVAAGLTMEVSVITVDAASGTARRKELTTHDTAARQAAWSPAGDILATGGFDGQVRLWSARGESLRKLSALRPIDTASVESLSWDATGQWLATGTSTGTVHVWNVADGTPVREPWFHGTRAERVALSPDGSRVAAAGPRYLSETGGYDQSWVSVWDTATGERTAFFRETVSRTSGGTAEAMTWSADGRQLLIAWGDVSWTRWDATTGGLSHVKAQGLSSSTGQAAFSPDARRLVTWGFGSGASVWDVESGALSARLAGGDLPSGLAWSPDGRFISGAVSAAGSTSGTPAPTRSSSTSPGPIPTGWRAPRGTRTGSTSPPWGGICA
ncbi:InlB B-repeat-containing protein [Pyxidicoccus sp. 3LFB2]